MEVLTTSAAVKQADAAAPTPNAVILPNLTSLRGIAALLVIFFHYHLFITPLITEKTSPIVGKLYLMVDLFFILSGFVMAHVYGPAFKTGVSGRGFWTFIGARFARIYPLHLLTLLVMIGLGLTANATGATSEVTRTIYNFSAIPAQILLLQGMGIQHEATWNSPTWSISVEWWTYLLFPFIALGLAHSGRWSRRLLAAIVAAGYAAVLFYFQPRFWAERWVLLGIPANVPYPMHVLDDITGIGALVRCVCGFAFGILLYEAFRSSRTRALVAPGYVFAAAWIALLGLWQFKRLSDGGAVVILGLIILSAACNADWVSRLLSHRVWRHMGDISYSLYLVHLPLILAFWIVRHLLVAPDPLAMSPMGYRFTKPEGIAGLAALYIAAIGAATLTYRFVEQPARRWLRTVL